VSSTHVELRISFTVSSDLDEGREAAEHAICAIDYLATHGQLDDCYDFEVTRGAVNGNGWEERWPDKPAPPAAPPWPPEGCVDLGHLEPGTVVQLPPGTTSVVWSE